MKAHIIFSKINRKTWFVKNRCGQSGHGHFGHFRFRGVFAAHYNNKNIFLLL